MPTFDEFETALPDPFARARIQLHIPDYEAELLIARPEWAATYYRQWQGEPVAAEPGAPIAMALAEQRSTAPTGDAIDAPAEAVQRTPRVWRRLAVVSAAAIVAGSLVLGGAAWSVLQAKQPRLTLPKSGEASSTTLGGSETGSALPGSSAGSFGTAQQQLIGRVGGALSIGADRTDSVPGLSRAVGSEIVHIADVACLGGGADSALGTELAKSLTDRNAATSEEAAEVSSAIQEYCNATT